MREIVGWFDSRGGLWAPYWEKSLSPEEVGLWVDEGTTLMSAARSAGRLDETEVELGQPVYLLEEVPCDE